MEDKEFKTGTVMDMLPQTTDDTANYVDKGIYEGTASIEDAIVKNEKAKIMNMPRKTRTIIREYNKIGRNDSCPCGSGKKYKNCCLETGKYEAKHELTPLEMGDIKLGKKNLSNMIKNA